MAPGQFQTVKDVADLLKVGEATVRRWIRDCDLRAIDVGRGWRIAPDDLAEFLSRHANRPHANEDVKTEVVDLASRNAPADTACSTTDKGKID